MFELKRLSKDAIPAALEKAMRYRMLGEPMEAESICLDVLAIDPENREALVRLFLACTDQLATRASDKFERARELLPRLGGDYEQAYYAGILYERRAKARLEDRGYKSGEIIHDWLVQAMAHFERAAALRPKGNDDALLRWNTCARILDGDPTLVAGSSEREEQMLE